jgi:CRISPR-associated protein Cas2
MIYLVVYDVEQKRVAKVHKRLKKYLHWIQNSVFEGELTIVQLRELKNELNSVIKKDLDAIIFFELGERGYRNKIILGYEKSPVDTFI